MIDPGDRRIAEVRRWPLKGGDLWTCTSCGRDFETDAAWSVTYRTGTREYRAAVCRPCAARYANPPRLVIDLTVAEESADPISREVLDRALHVVGQRSGAVTGPVVLRSEDVLDLADASGSDLDAWVAWIGRRRGVSLA